MNDALRPHQSQAVNHSLHPDAFSSGLLSANSRLWPNRAGPQNGNLISSINPYHMTHEYSSIPLDLLRRNLANIKNEMKELRQEYQQKQISHSNYHRRLTKLNTEFTALQAALAKSHQYSNFNQTINGVPEHTANITHDETLVESMDHYRQDLDFGLHREPHDTPGFMKHIDQGFMINLQNKMLTPQEMIMGESQQDKYRRYHISDPDRLGANPNVFISTAPPLYKLGMQMYGLPDDKLNISLVHQAANRIKEMQDKDPNYYRYYHLQRYPHNHLTE